MATITISRDLRGKNVKGVVKVGGRRITGCTMGVRDVALCGEYIELQALDCPPGQTTFCCGDTRTFRRRDVQLTEVVP